MKYPDLEIIPPGNPVMKMKFPYDPDWLRNINMPDALMSNLPGFEKMTSGMMKKTMRDKGVASTSELGELSLADEVKLVACQMTVNLFGMQQDEFIPESEDWIGAASFLPKAQKADMSLFV